MDKTATLEYIKTRVVSSDSIVSGDITTTCIITFDNGFTTSGESVRDISSYSAEEAQGAAYNNAIESLIPGVDFVLAKK